jgi:hypothetical protein
VAPSDASHLFGPDHGQVLTPCVPSAEQWAEVIRFLTTDLRLDTVVFWPEHASVEQIKRFGRDVTTRALERIRQLQPVQLTYRTNQGMSNV